MNKTFNNYITIDNHSYPINSKVSGVYQEAIKEMISQLVIFTQHYSKSLFLRVDLHVSEYTETNDVISNFIKSFKRKIKSKYKITKLCFVWCREIWKSDAQHYHVIIGVDGHKVKHSHNLIGLIEELWPVRLGTFWIPDNCFYFLRNNKPDYYEIISSILYRVSYLAKVRSKQDLGRKGKMYGRSKLKQLHPFYVGFR